MSFHAFKSFEPGILTTCIDRQSDSNMAPLPLTLAGVITNHAEGVVMRMLDVRLHTLSTLQAQMIPILENFKSFGDPIHKQI